MSSAPLVAGSTSPTVPPTTPPTYKLSQPLQPHAYPYLSDKFYYTGFGASATLDTAATTVGGYASDGWSKMFEFFEVPSQMIGAIGPVANGTNFDWARQDFKPGLLNLNLIVDEEVYDALLGKQAINQQGGQPVTPAPPTTPPSTPSVNPQVPFDQFNQDHLNFNQVTGFDFASGKGTVPPGAYTAYGTAVGTATGPPYLLPLAAGSAPIPFVVTATKADGTPVAAYPLTSPGLLDNDPTTNFGDGAAGIPILYNNALKASFIQFLSLRHGGSGYIYGYGSGSVGQNLAVTAPPLPTPTPPLAGAPSYVGLPADIPFHSLSYPDIDYTVMRPAALPPTTFTFPQSNNLVNLTATPPTYYAGDPGVRNPNVSFGYTTGLPPGLVLNAGAFVFNQVYPPAIPTRRLFQIPDAYNPGVASATAPAPSNAGESGDPFINNLTPIIPTTDTPPVPPLPSTGALPPYTVLNTSASGAIYATGTVVPNPSYVNGSTAASVPNSGVVNLYWPGPFASTFYAGGIANPPAGVSLPSVRNPYLVPIAEVAPPMSRPISGSTPTGEWWRCSAS